MKRVGAFTVLSLAISFLLSTEAPRAKVEVLAVAPAQVQQPGSAADRFEVSDVMIPMRDGKRLNTKIFTPRLRQGSGEAALAEDGYIFVHQDLRGKFGSEGDLVMQRPARGSDRNTADSRPRL